MTTIFVDLDFFHFKKSDNLLVTTTTIVNNYYKLLLIDFLYLTVKQTQTLYSLLCLCLYIS